MANKKTPDDDVSSLQLRWTPDETAAIMPFVDVICRQWERENPDQVLDRETLLQQVASDAIIEFASEITRGLANQEANTLRQQADLMAAQARAVLMPQPDLTEEDDPDGP